jgi:NADH-quinone oxidoreductase subunit G
LMTACSVPVAQDMVVRTETEQVKATQEANLAFILLNHPLDCPICDKGGECPLQDQTMRFGPGISQLVEPKRHKNKHYLISDTIVLDQERCVVCWRCIRYLEEWEDKPQLGLFERGGDTIIDIQDGQPVDAKTSGNIIDICPVGALTNRVARFAYRDHLVALIAASEAAALAALSEAFLALAVLVLVATPLALSLPSHRREEMSTHDSHRATHTPRQ